MPRFTELSTVQVAVVNAETGQKLTGEDAPLASQLEKWLEANPGYEVAPREDNSGDEDNEEVRRDLCVRCSYR